MENAVGVQTKMLKNNKHYYSFWEVKALSYTCLSKNGKFSYEGWKGGEGREGGSVMTYLLRLIPGAIFYSGFIMLPHSI
jgi:hypothetical protein